MTTSKQSWLFVLGGFVLFSLLAAGFYTLAQLQAGEPAAAVDSGASGRVIDMVAMDDSGVPLAVRTRILPATELPSDEPAINGVLLERRDNSLLIGTGAIDLEADIEVDPETGAETVELVPRTSGPEIEVVIGVDTIFYADITNLNADLPAESGEREVQQVVRQVDSLADLPAQAEIQVWGRQRGDRLTAEILVYAPLGGGMFE